MLIGNGMIATIFKEYLQRSTVVVFASGVANSNETSQVKFLKEKNILEDILKKYKDKQFIYFSSCSIDDIELQKTPYHMHKKEMELLIKKYSTNYLIFRLPNVIGNLGNQNTIINFFINQIKNRQLFNVWKYATRNIVDIEHMYQIVSYIINNNLYINRTINIAYDNNNNILDIIYAIESLLNIKAEYNVENKGTNMIIDNSLIQPVMFKLGIVQPNITELINKYKG